MARRQTVWHAYVRVGSAARHPLTRPKSSWMGGCDGPCALLASEEAAEVGAWVFAGACHAASHPCWEYQGLRFRPDPMLCLLWHSPWLLCDSPGATQSISACFTIVSSVMSSALLSGMVQ